MKRKLSLLSIVVWFAIHVTASGQDSADDTSQRVAEQWIGYFQSIKSVQCDNELSSKRIGDLGNPDTTTKFLSTGTDGFCWEHSGRLAIRSKATAADGRQIPSEVLFDGKRFLNGGIDPQVAPSLASLLKPSSDNPKVLRELPEHLCCLLGVHTKEFLPKDQGQFSLIKLLRQREKLRSVGERRLEWVGERYKIVLEADTGRGFAPAKVEYRLLKTPKVSEPRVVTLKSVEFSDWEESGGVLFPTKSLEIRELSEGLDWDGEKKPASRTVTEGKLSKIVLNREIADSVFEFRLPIPDYTLVQMLDAEQLKFYWLKGEVVPATDEEAAKIALDAAASRLAGKNRWQKYIWIVGGLAACLALGVLYDRLRQRR